MGGGKPSMSAGHGMPCPYEEKQKGRAIRGLSQDFVRGPFALLAHFCSAGDYAHLSMDTLTR